MEMNKLTDYIVWKDNFLEKNVSNKFERIVKSNFIEFNKAEVTTDDGNVLREDIRKTEVFSLNNYEGKLTTINLCNFIGVGFGKLIDFYGQKTNTFSETIIQSMQILKYNKNGFYKTHIDHGLATPRTLSIVYFINSIWIYKITYIWSIKFLQPISHLFFRRKFHKIFETVPLFITLLNPFICKLSFRTITLSGATIILPHLLCKIAFLVIFAYCI